MSALLASTQYFDTPDTRFFDQVSFDRVAGDRWRVRDHRSLRILGHIRLESTPRGTRVIAERFHVVDGLFRPLGEFWRSDDAVEALRSF